MLALRAAAAEAGARVAGNLLSAGLNIDICTIPGPVYDDSDWPVGNLSSNLSGRRSRGMTSQISGSLRERTGADLVFVGSLARSLLVGFCRAELEICFDDQTEGRRGTVEAATYWCAFRSLEGSSRAQHLRGGAFLLDPIRSFRSWDARPPLLACRAPSCNGVEIIHYQLFRVWRRANLKMVIRPGRWSRPRSLQAGWPARFRERAQQSSFRRLELGRRAARYVPAALRCAKAGADQTKELQREVASRRQHLYGTSGGGQSSRKAARGSGAAQSVAARLNGSFPLLSSQLAQ